ncbi:MAG TPA: hypothetical protein VHM94_02245 [Acidimicrobiia bacterium]|jgi:hypothetical protein|nr:hypothetical protein [Acidimicrobiia bacterium]
MRRPITLVVAAASLAVAGLGAAAPPAGLLVTPETPGDVAVLAAATFERFIEAAPALDRCIGRVRLAGAWSLGDRGSYDADTSSITVRIPGTAPRLAATLVHELAHHVDLACLSEDVRASFRRVQGLSANSPWDEGASWAEVPAEQFAETMVEAVLGRRSPTLGVRIEPVAVELITRWAQGG